MNEIDNEGNEAILTDFKLPIQPKDEQDDKTTASIEDELVQLITKEKLEEVRNIANIKGKCTDIVEIDVTELSKEDRGKIHNNTKSLFGSAIVGSTITKNERKYITFTAYDKFNVKDRRQKWLWPHPFTYFLLYKENVDTIQATSQLAECMRCSPSSFAYAGTKDRRAKTTQWISIKHYEPSKIVAAVKKIKNIKVGNFCFKPNTLKLGQLEGNRFRIALRQLSVEENVIKTSLDNFREKGFINYFGLQRFGNSSSIPTYMIGIEMLKGCWKEACDLILKPRNGDPWFMKQMRDEWSKTGNAESALNKLSPSNKSIEKQILRWLSSHENDYKGALEHLPRNMRLLYCHSYQSLVWNRIASRRIQEYSCRLIPGDLVFIDDSVAKTIKEEIIDENTSLDLTEPNSQEEENEDQSTELSHYKNMVKPLTEADIESGKYTIFDIVLPLPGHDITYPKNDCGKWYEEVLAEDGLSSEKLKRKSKKESLTGAYRKVFIKPENLEWSIVPYEKTTDTLILSDLEKMHGDKLDCKKGKYFFLND